MNQSGFTSLLILIIILVLVIMGGSVYYAHTKLNESQPTPTTTQTINSNTGRKIYVSKDNFFSFSYAGSDTLAESTPASEYNSLAKGEIENVTVSPWCDTGNPNLPNGCFPNAVYLFEVSEFTNTNNWNPNTWLKFAPDSPYNPCKEIDPRTKLIQTKFGQDQALEIDSILDGQFIRNCTPPFQGDFQPGTEKKLIIFHKNLYLYISTFSSDNKFKTELDQIFSSFTITNLNQNITPTCIPRPSCLDTIPRCLVAEPLNGWCK